MYIRSTEYTRGFYFFELPKRRQVSTSQLRNLFRFSHSPAYVHVPPVTADPATDPPLIAPQTRNASRIRIQDTRVPAAVCPVNSRQRRCGDVMTDGNV